jgi:hypothetical protein
VRHRARFGNVPLFQGVAAGRWLARAHYLAMRHCQGNQT